MQDTLWVSTFIFYQKYIFFEENGLQAFLSLCDELLVVNLDNRWGFNTNITNICSQVNKKFHVLTRLSQFMSGDNTQS